MNIYSFLHAMENISLRRSMPAWISAFQRNALFFGLMCSKLNIITTARYMEHSLYWRMECLFKPQLVLEVLRKWNLLFATYNSCVSWSRTSSSSECRWICANEVRKFAINLLCASSWSGVIGSCALTNSNTARSYISVHLKIFETINIYTYDVMTFNYHWWKPMEWKSQITGTYTYTYYVCLMFEGDFR